MVSKSKGRSNGAIFDWDEYHGALFKLEGMAAEIVEGTRRRYESCKNNASILASDLPDDKKQNFLWEYCCDYHHTWHVTDCTGNYCCG